VSFLIENLKLKMENRLMEENTVRCRGRQHSSGREKYRSAPDLGEYSNRYCAVFIENGETGEHTG
jgi:hypothetical protein